MPAAVRAARRGGGDRAGVEGLPGHAEARDCRSSGLEAAEADGRAGVPRRLDRAPGRRLRHERRARPDGRRARRGPARGDGPPRRRAADRISWDGMQRRRDIAASLPPRAARSGGSRLVIRRYTLPEMGALWSEEARFEHMLRVELAVSRAQARRGRVPQDALAAIEARATIDVDRIEELERTTDHDVIAFVSQVAESIGPEGRYLHLGLTSSDVVDTALALQLRAAGELLLRDADRLIEVLVARARAEAGTVMMGRTHSVHAEPTTFGLKLAGWAFEVDRGRRRLAEAIDEIATGKLSGPVGTYSHLEPEVEAEVMAELELRVDPASTQIVQRDRHAAFLTAIAILGGSLERFATEIRNLQHTEIGEVMEPFKAGQKGSSAMPHKRNPILSERVAGLARVLRGYAGTALENQPLWHERDISHSSAERVILPDATILLDYLLQKVTEARPRPRRPAGADAREHRARPRAARLVARPARRWSRGPGSRGRRRTRSSSAPRWPPPTSAARCASCSRSSRPSRARSASADLDACFDDARHLAHVPEVIARLDALLATPRRRRPMLTADRFIRSGKVRDLYGDRRRSAAARRIGSDLGVRRRPADRHPGQGPRADRAVALLVRRDARRRRRTTSSGRTRRACREDVASGARSRTSSRAGCWSVAGRRCCRSRSSCAATCPGSGWREYRQAQLRVRRAAAGGAARERPPAGADPDAGDEGGAGRARHQHRLRIDRPAPRRLAAERRRLAGRRRGARPCRAGA